MPAQRRFGMDHEHYDWSPISTRDILRWPEAVSYTHLRAHETLR